MTTAPPLWTATPADFGLEQVANFRDFGGHALDGGARVKRGVLFRSANLFRATPADQAQLAALGMRVAVDLRRSSEREAEPSKWPAQAMPRIITSDDHEADRTPLHLKYLQSDGPITAEATHAYMLSAYKRIPFEGRYIAMFRAGFEALAADETPFLVHCAAGKDRTGVFCALVLHVLGVAAADIQRDYLRTNDAPDFERRLTAATLRFSKRFNRELDAAAVRPIMGVDGAYLDSAHAEMADRCGSVSQYVSDVLELDAAFAQRLRAALVEPAPKD